MINYISSSLCVIVTCAFVIILLEVGAQPLGITLLVLLQRLLATHVCRILSWHGKCFAFLSPPGKREKRVKSGTVTQRHCHATKRGGGGGGKGIFVIRFFWRFVNRDPLKNCSVNRD